MWIWDDDGSRSCGDSAIFISLSKSGEERPTNKRTRDLKGAWDLWRHWQPTHCRPISGSSGRFLTSNYLSISSQSTVNNADFQQTAGSSANRSTETEVDVPKKRKSTLLRAWVVDLSLDSWLTMVSWERDVGFMRSPRPTSRRYHHRPPAIPPGEYTNL